MKSSKSYAILLNSGGYFYCGFQHGVPLRQADYYETPEAAQKMIELLGLNAKVITITPDAL